MCLYEACQCNQFLDVAVTAGAGELVVLCKVEGTKEGAMTLAALLTVFSITLAIFSLARPVGRRSLALFVPVWRMVAAICLSFICIIIRGAPFGVKPPFHWRLDLVE